VESLGTLDKTDPAGLLGGGDAAEIEVLSGTLGRLTDLARKKFRIKNRFDSPKDVGFGISISDHVAKRDTT
jgi:hypothetical protein